MDQSYLEISILTKYTENDIERQEIFSFSFYFQIDFTSKNHTHVLTHTWARVYVWLYV